MTDAITGALPGMAVVAAACFARTFLVSGLKGLYASSILLLFGAWYALIGSVGGFDDPAEWQVLRPAWDFTTSVMGVAIAFTILFSKGYMR